MKLPNTRQRKYQDDCVSYNVERSLSPVECNAIYTMRGHGEVEESSDRRASKDRDERSRNTDHRNDGNTHPSDPAERLRDEDAEIEEDDGDFNNGVTGDI